MLNSILCRFSHNYNKKIIFLEIINTILVVMYKCYIKMNKLPSIRTVESLYRLFICRLKSVD